MPQIRKPRAIRKTNPKKPYRLNVIKDKKELLKLYQKQQKMKDIEDQRQTNIVRKDVRERYDNQLKNARNDAYVRTKLASYVNGDINQLNNTELRQKMLDLYQTTPAELENLLKESKYKNLLDQLKDDANKADETYRETLKNKDKSTSLGKKQLKILKEELRAQRKQLKSSIEDMAKIVKDALIKEHQPIPVPAPTEAAPTAPIIGMEEAPREPMTGMEEAAAEEIGAEKIVPEGTELIEDIAVKAPAELVKEVSEEVRKEAEKGIPIDQIITFYLLKTYKKSQKRPKEYYTDKQVDELTWEDYPRISITPEEFSLLSDKKKEKIMSIKEQYEGRIKLDTERQLLEEERRKIEETQKKLQLLEAAQAKDDDLESIVDAIGDDEDEDAPASAIPEPKGLTQENIAYENLKKKYGNIETMTKLYSSGTRALIDLAPSYKKTFPKMLEKLGNDLYYYLMQFEGIYDAQKAIGKDRGSTPQAVTIKPYFEKAKKMQRKIEKELQIYQSLRQKKRTGQGLKRHTRHKIMGKTRYSLETLLKAYMKGKRTNNLINLIWDTIDKYLITKKITKKQHKQISQMLTR